MTSSLKDAFEKADDSNVNLEVKVIQIIKTEKPTNGKKYMLIKVGDNTGTAYLKLYKEDQFEKFSQLPSLLLMNVLKKSTNFIFTNKSMASFCRTVEFEDREICRQSCQTEATIHDIIDQQGGSNVGKTIKCRVVHVSPVKDRTNSYTGNPLKLRHLLVKDKTKTAKMALWNDVGEMEYSPGDVIEVSNVKVTAFEGKKLLGSTPKSAVQFLSLQDTDIPEVTKDDSQLALEDPDFKETSKKLGVIKGFDNVRVYQICSKRQCMNKEIKNGVCGNCSEPPEKDMKYMKATLSVENLEKTEVSNLILFFPDYCTLYAYLDLDTDLDPEIIKTNLIGVVGVRISYDLRKSCLTNISIKRKESF